ncbi:hypothetical protein J6590_089221 [Homalodisca vitripennis]|nr:hypothetical protein J6590_089221 [Homalodisca vitripennis]
MSQAAKTPIVAVISVHPPPAVFTSVRGRECTYQPAKTPIVAVISAHPVPAVLTYVSGRDE